MQELAQQVTTQRLDIVAGAGEQAERFFEYYQQARGLKPETLKTYMKALKKFYYFLEENKECIKGATRRHIVAYKQMLDLSYENKHTAKLYFTIVKSFYAFLASEGYINRNIAEGIVAFKDINKEQTHRRERLSSCEVKEVMQGINQDTITGARDYAILALCFTGAFRRVELYRANIEDIREHGGAYGIFIQGKGRDTKGDFVKIPPRAREALERYLSLRGKTEPTAPLFIRHDHATDKCERLSLVSLSKVAKRHFTEAGIDTTYKTLHSTRHTAISTYLDKTNDLAGSQRLARHLDPKTTMIYIHDLEETKSKATSVVEDALF